MLGTASISSPPTRVAGASVGAGIVAAVRFVAPVQAAVTRSGTVVTGAETTLSRQHIHVQAR